LAKERDEARPRISGRVRAVHRRPRVVHERVPGARIQPDLERLTALGQAMAQLVDVGERDERILLAVEPEHRTADVRDRRGRGARGSGGAGGSGGGPRRGGEGTGPKNGAPADSPAHSHAARSAYCPPMQTPVSPFSRPPVAGCVRSASIASCTVSRTTGSDSS